MKSKKYKWIVWNVATISDGTLESFGYKLVDNSDRDKYTCILPLIHFQELAEKYGALHVLRTSQCRPRDPYELVRFIKKFRHSNLNTIGDGDLTLPSKQ